MAETGGIQHDSPCLVQALLELFPTAQLRVLSKNDAPSAALPDHVHAFGHLPKAIRTAAFATAGVAWAWKERPTACLLTHPHFAKVLTALPFPAEVPVLAVTHGIETWGHLNGRLLAGLKRCRGCLPVSEFTRQVMLQEGGFDPQRLITVPDTFRENAFSPGPKPDYLLQRHGLTKEQPLLFTVGRLAASESYKGQDRVIAALPAIRRVFPEARYLIAGSGDDAERLRQCAAAHGQTEAVIFAGYVPEHELADYYRLCDAFVMPSTGEGFGIVYLEALASGKPCIVGNRDASPEALGHGRLGLVVDPLSTDAIAEAVLTLLNRQHDKPWLHEPDTLHREVIALFGFAAFKRSLANALQALLSKQGSNHQEPGTASSER